MTQILETVTRTALLGVRFWDRATGRVVADGLELVETGSGVRLAAGPSGVLPPVRPSVKPLLIAGTARRPWDRS